MSERGFFAVGVVRGKSPCNVGTLLRSAEAFGAAFVFTVGARYSPERTDTTQMWRRTPCFHFTDIEALLAGLPLDTDLVAVELLEGAKLLQHFRHPERAAYLLGAEDHGLSAADLARCTRRVQVDSSRCLNVAVAGSIVMWHRSVSRQRAMMEVAS